MKFSNQNIISNANALAQNFAELTVYIPAKANFFIQKNISVFINAAQEIEKSRIEILKHYGTLDETEQQYKIPDDKIPEALQEMEELFSIEQELDIKTFSIENLGNTEFTPAQMQAILFMIEE